ncbi:RsmD family RNA methyltransferase [Persephonella sp.]
MKGFRPTSAKVRQALFNILFDVTGESFLDLFAGTGQVGMAALEKGARPVYFVEKDRRRAQYIKRKLQGKSTDWKVINQDVLRFLKNYTGEPFDIIFADPPYDYRHYNKLIELSLGNLKEGGVFILEHRADKSFGADEERKYGDTVLSFWRK